MPIADANDAPDLMNICDETRFAFSVSGHEIEAPDASNVTVPVDEYKNTGSASNVTALAIDVANAIAAAAPTAASISRADLDM